MLPRTCARRFFLVIGATALCIPSAGAVAQAQTREEAIRQAQQQAEHMRAQQLRRHQAQRQNDQTDQTERSIVLPQDYPVDQAFGDPVRSGVPMSAYTWMLRDLDPAYRMFAVGQLARFDLRGRAERIFPNIDEMRGSERGRNAIEAIESAPQESIIHSLESAARSDPDPGVRVFAMGHLARIDPEAGQNAARAMLDELPHWSGARSFVLTALACAAPEEYLPEVRRWLLEAGDPNTASSYRLWVAYMTLAPFEDSLSLIEEIGRQDSAAPRDGSHRIRFATRDPMGGLTAPPPTVAFGQLSTAMLPADPHNTSDREVHAQHDAVASLLERMLTQALVDAMRDDEVRAHLQERFPPDTQRRSSGFDPMGHRRDAFEAKRSIPEEFVRIARFFASYDPSDRFGDALFAAIDRAFASALDQADEQDRPLIERMRARLGDDQHRVEHTGFRPGDAAEALRFMGRISAGSLLGPGPSADRFAALLESTHESPSDDHWFVSPDCLSRDAGSAGR
ncbi:MAG: hypothetical protein ACTS3F_00485 [Phycisphaerales bacterium]